MDDAIALAVKHADAISDTGDGYAMEHRCRGWWRVDCLRCEWFAEAPTKRRAIALYHIHEDTTLAPLRAVTS